MKELLEEYKRNSLMQMRNPLNSGAGLLSGLKKRLKRSKYTGLRAKILEPNYLDSRLSQIERTVAGWVYRGKISSTYVEKQFCKDMVRMYLSRYHWYIREWL